ncbi:hypothetical protein [Metamycoplasma auris]|uniref:Uncharacterized protein n=1 Tax=Metamycoplasma auris TaxID=51363 RepID=A0A2W7FXM3_9BACT|nr:hypothetical protein [Metamycoplasma auris]PZV98736.1 hypothetical protein BCF89_1114 [Metamycoplasma auris]
MKRTREGVGPIKKYDDFKFIDNLAADLRDELIRFFGKDNGLKTYVYSLLGILCKNRYDWYKDNYNHSFISKEYPNIPVSKSSVASFIKQLGVYDSLNKEFLTSRLVDHEILFLMVPLLLTMETLSFLNMVENTNKQEENK